MLLNSLIAKKKVLSQEKKKGFTLVELLVVIAIIAILATVSTVGYLGFTKQAKISNDLTELTQYKTLITGLALDEKGTKVKTDDNTEYTITYAFETGSQHVLKMETVAGENKTAPSQTIASTLIKKMLGDDWIEGSNVIVNFDTTADKTTNVTSIEYYHHYDGNKDGGTQKGSVKWDIASDTVSKLA